MKKVSRIWQLLAIFAIGFALGLFVSFKYVQRNTPEGQNISIGDIRIRGRGEHQVNLQVDQKKEDPPVADEQPKKKKRRIRR
jgi:hypothetical protein